MRRRRERALCPVNTPRTSKQEDPVVTYTQNLVHLFASIARRLFDFSFELRPLDYTAGCIIHLNFKP